MNTFIQSPDNSHVSIQDHAFIKFTNDNLIDNDNETQLLPVPVLLYVKPTLSVQFLHHILLSMGSFHTEIDLIMHDSICESFCYAKLIGPSNDPSDLQAYSDRLLYRYIEDQLQYFPNSKRVLMEWITIAGDLFDSVILINEISISDMPPVQLSSLFGSTKESIREYCQKKKGIFYESIKLELEDTMELCNVPSKDDMLAAKKSNPLTWDAVDNMQQKHHQSDASFTEQKLAVKTYGDAIDKYANVIGQTSLTKNIGIRGFPGSGKAWCSLYIALYAMSKGLFTLPTALLSKRAIQLGGIHWHKLFCIPTEKNMNNHRKAELAIIQILQKPKTLQLILCLDVLICDEMGQLSADFLAVVDIILRRLRENSLYLGGLLVICTLDHLQIQSIESRPFMIPMHIISCFSMVELKSSVRASNDPSFQRIQEIVRFSQKKLQEHPELIEDFITLCSNHLTFVDDWNDHQITPSTMRLYSKKSLQKKLLEILQHGSDCIFLQLILENESQMMLRNLATHIKNGIVLQIETQIY